MRLRLPSLWLLLCGLAILIAPLPLFSETSPAPSRPSNAALIYRTAFATLPELTEHEKASFATIGQKAAREDNAFDRETATTIVEKASSSLANIDHALNIPQCDWQLDYSAGPGLSLPHLTKAITAANILALRASLRLADAEPAEAVEDQSRILRMSRHIVQNDQLLITALVQLSIENISLHTIAANFSKYDAPSLKALQTTLATLPPRMQMQAAITTDNKITLAWFRKLSRSLERRAEAAKDSQALPDLGIYLKGFAYRLASPIKTLSQLNSAIDGFESDSHHLAQLLSLPYEEANVKIEDFSKQVSVNHREDRLLSALIIPSFASTLPTEMRVKIHGAMLQTAIAIHLHGPDALATIKDPLTGEVFIYKTLDHGFELTSQGKIDEKPVSLIFR